MLAVFAILAAAAVVPKSPEFSVGVYPRQNGDLNLAGGRWLASGS